MVIIPHKRLKLPAVQCVPSVQHYCLPGVERQDAALRLPRSLSWDLWLCCSAVCWLWGLIWGLCSDWYGVGVAGGQGPCGMGATAVHHLSPCHTVPEPPPALCTWPLDCVHWSTGLRVNSTSGSLTCILSVTFCLILQLTGWRWLQACIIYGKDQAMFSHIFRQF